MTHISALISQPSRLRTAVLLAVVVLLGLGLRLWGINFGLPYMYHPDEPVIIEKAQHMVQTGDLNPHFFQYPSLYLYINAFAYIPYYLVGKTAGVFNSIQDISPPRMLTMGVGYSPMATTVLMSRLLSAFVGTATILIIFFAGRKIFRNDAIGLLAALLVAVSPTAVQESRFITVNSHLAAITALVLWAGYGIYADGRLRYYLLSGLFTGLAISLKYPGALVGIAIPIAHFLRRGWAGWKDKAFYLGIFMIPLAFLATTPYAVLDYAKFLEDTLFEAGHYSSGHDGMEGGAPAWYINYIWQTEGIIGPLAVVALVVGLIRKHVPTIITAVFPFIYYFFISSFEVRNGRTALPMLSFLALLAASIIVFAFRYFRENWTENRKYLAQIILVVMVIGSLSLSLNRVIAGARRITAVDGRETARLWIEENLPQGSKIALEAYAPYIKPENFNVIGIGKIPDHPAQWYVENDFDFLIFAQGMFGRYFREPEKYPDEVTAYQAFFDHLKLVGIFDDGNYEVKIYQVSQ